VCRHGENGSVEIDSPQKIQPARFALNLDRPGVYWRQGPTDAVIRRAKRDGHSSVYHGGLVSLLARMRLLQPIATRGRIEKPGREARLENDQFEWDRANLTIIKVSGDAERQDRA